LNLDHSGTGLLKFVSPFISVGSNAGTYNINLLGSTAGTGELPFVIPAYNAKTTNLTKSGTGTWTLSNANTYTGLTTVSGGALVLTNANALPGGLGVTGGLSALTFNGGVIGLGNGDFTRGLAAAGTVTAATFSGNGGWAAYGADRVVNLGGAAATITWATANTGLNGKTLILGAATATNLVDFQNPLDLGAATRTVQVDDGTAAVDARMSGILSGAGGALTKTGIGTLELTAVNSYSGVTTISSGTLSIGGAGQLGGGTYAANITDNSALVYNSSAAQTLSGIISGSGTLTLSGTGTLTLAGLNTYTGDTTVAAGLLAVNGTSINDANKLIITGGKVAPTGTETVNTLFFGLTQKAAGTWGATGSGATHIDDAHFAGTAGVVNVTTGPAISDYDSWAGQSFAAAFTDTDPSHDPDGDGMSNFKEYAFGLDPTTGSSVNPISVPLNKSTGMFTYTRRDPALTGLTYKVDTSTTLTSWSPDATAVQTVTATVNNVQTVQVQLSGPVPLPGATLFVRIDVQ